MLFFSNDKPKLKLKLKRWKVEGTLELSQHEKSAFGEELGMAAGTTDDAAIKATIRTLHAKFGYTIDPHTAVAAAVAAEVQGSGPAVIVMACAHPLKFRGTVEAALGKPASEWVLEKDKKDQAGPDHCGVQDGRHPAAIGLGIVPPHSQVDGLGQIGALPAQIILYAI